MRARELSAQLERRARADGFDLVGIGAAERLAEDGAALRNWLREGRQASLDWMGRDPELRADPTRLMPGCRSVVALAVNYWPGDVPERVGRGHGRVARYAWGRDYHKVVGRKLRELAEWLERESGQPARAFVDSAPLLERGWARRSGVGWIGKNANLLTRELGSWLLLGEVLSAAKLVPAPGPHPSFCGSCTKCIDACPTGAIVDDGVVDCKRCISYWTIEHRGPIPAARRGQLGDWIFGCDVCQEVCPWNRRFARPAPAERFRRRPGLEALDAAELVTMHEATFRERFSGTSFMRARWDGMRRNACIVLGNLRSAEAVPVLTAVLQDPDPVVRSHAAWALGRIGGGEALESLSRARRSEPAAAVRDEIDRAQEEGRSG